MSEVDDNSIVYIHPNFDSDDHIMLFYDLVKRGTQAILCEHIGRTDHGAILANELNIPCITHIDRAIERLEGEIISVDDRRVFRGTSSIPTPEAEPGVDYLDTETHLKINLGFPEVVREQPDLIAAIDGVGFMRLEFILLDILDRMHPWAYIARHSEAHLAEEIAGRIEPVASALDGRPLWIRTDDFSTKQLIRMDEGERFESPEENPMLGWRGIARSIAEPSLLRAEFLAIRHLAENGSRNIGVFPPMTRFIEEYDEWKTIAQEVGIEDCTYGLMIETPAAALTFDEFVEEIEFMIFGSNDLTQFTLAIDRHHPKLADKFTENNRAVLTLMRDVIDQCEANAIDSSIGGEAASNREVATTLLEYGISGVSVTPNDAVVSRAQSILSNFERGR